ncbi:hypothetical protein CIPAW_04G121100 [Carya illinoinensis]|uniref:Uncharacterized protein n=1 Tax=Carya illinoinensis TaxID=32201 RepID=A0A8T1QUR9_CARIL|nr:hypothetical protein CIPAW_04G121100 [Carya illinoinensis]
MMRRILIDNESSTDILLWEAFIKMRISPDRLCLAPVPLKGFTGNVVKLIGVITLSILAEKAPRTTATMSNFLVVKAPFEYNVIDRRPTLNSLRVVTSKYHLKMKFFTNLEMGEICGE